MATLTRIKGENLQEWVGRVVWTVQVVVAVIFMYASFDIANNWLSELWDVVRIAFAATLFGTTQVYSIQYQGALVVDPPGKAFAWIMALVSAAWLAAGLLWIQAFGPLKWGFLVENGSEVVDSNAMIWVLSFIVSAGAAWAVFYHRFIRRKGRYLATVLHVAVLGCIFLFLSAASVVLWYFYKPEQNANVFLLNHAIKGFAGLYWLWPSGIYLWTFRNNASLLNFVSARKNGHMS